MLIDITKIRPEVAIPVGETLISFTELSPDNPEFIGPNEYGSYTIRLEFQHGFVYISGCHDCGPKYTIKLKIYE